MSEIDTIIHVLSGGVILLLIFIIYKLVKKINRMYDRITAVDDYLLSKFLSNERNKEDATTGE